MSQSSLATDEDPATPLAISVALIDPKPFTRRSIEDLFAKAFREYTMVAASTCGKYFRNAFARNAGLRIDHFLLSPSIADRLVAAGVDRDVRGRERASDHAPVWIELADAKADRRAERDA